MASGDVDATDRLLDRWYLQAFPCRSPVNDLAHPARQHVPVQHYALPSDDRRSGTWWYLAGALLHLRFCWLLLLQSVSLLSYWPASVI